jgi:hypothetical protein
MSLARWLRLYAGKRTIQDIERTVDCFRQGGSRRVDAAGPHAVVETNLHDDPQWDFDRTVETEASLMGLFGLALGITVDKRFFALPAFVSTMLVLHATHGGIGCYRCSAGSVSEHEMRSIANDRPVAAFSRCRPLSLPSSFSTPLRGGVRPFRCNFDDVSSTPSHP